MALPDTDVAVIGAGTYGVSVALALHRRGIETHVFGRPFTLWLEHTLPTFSLRSDARSSGIHGGEARFSLVDWLTARVPRAALHRWMMRRIPGRTYRDYLRWVVEQLPFTTVPDRVTHLSRDGQRFHVTTARETVSARRVVLATGLENHRYLPAALRALPPERVVHSWDADAVAALDGARVLVVGGGQSAAEACLELAPGNRVSWIHRSRLAFFNEPLGLPGPVFRGTQVLAAQLRRLSPRARTSLAAQFTRPTVVPALRPRLRAASIRALLADVNCIGLGSTNGSVYAELLDQSYDRVVACTGYRMALRTLPFLSAGLRRDLATPSDQPELDARFGTCVPGLHVIGGLATWAHGAAQRFMFGSRAAADGVVRAMTT